jgi:hypothetical protein
LLLSPLTPGIPRPRRFSGQKAIAMRGVQTKSARRADLTPIPAGRTDNAPWRAGSAHFRKFSHRRLNPGKSGAPALDGAKGRM